MDEAKMSILCPHCKAKIAGTEQQFSRRFACPRCGNGIDKVDGANAQPRTAKMLMDGSSFDKIKRLMTKNETIQWQGQASLSALILKSLGYLILPCAVFIFPLCFSMPPALAWIPLVLAASVIAIGELFIYAAWKRTVYAISDRRTYAISGIFNIMVRVIPNNNVQSISINTGIVDRLLGLNTVVVNSAASGAPIMWLLPAGSIRMLHINDYEGAVKAYHS